MQRKAVVAIGLTVCLITAGAAGYIVYRSSSADDQYRHQTAQDGSTPEPDSPELNPDTSEDTNDTSPIADTMTEQHDQTDTTAQDEPNQTIDEEKSPHSSQQERSSRQHSRNGDKVDDKTRRRATDAINRILTRAKSYQPRSDHECKRTITPAIHRASGVRYNFKYDCLPKGWIKVSDRRGPNR